MKWLGKGKAVKYEYGAASVGVLLGIFLIHLANSPDGSGGQNFSSCFCYLVSLKCWFLKSDPVMKHIPSSMKQLLHLLKSSYQSWQIFFLIVLKTDGLCPCLTAASHSWLWRSFFLQKQLFPITAPPHGLGWLFCVFFRQFWHKSSLRREVLICAAFVCGWPLSAVTSYLRIACKPWKGWESVWDLGLKCPCGITETNSPVALVDILNMDDGTGHSLAGGCCCGPTRCAGVLAQSLCAQSRCVQNTFRVCFKALGGSFSNKWAAWVNR